MSNKKALYPMPDRIMVEPEPQDELSKGGLVIPETAKDKKQFGTVIEVGVDIPANMELKKGSKIIYDRYAGTLVKYNEKDILFLSSTDIIARVI